MSKGKVEKKKILWISDAVATTGFARVAHSIITKLPRTKYDVHQLGVNYMGDPHEFNYSIYPALIGGDVYGVNRLESMIKGIKPDLIFILNDPWIIDIYLKELIAKKLTDTPVVVYFPVDAREHNPEWFKQFHLVYKTCVYTQFAKKVMMDTGVFTDENDIEVVPHGVDLSRFYPIKDRDKISGREMAVRELLPWKQDPTFLNSFIVLNANRNQPRKRIDLTLRAFAEFSKDKPNNTRLYCHMGVTDAGNNILVLAKRYGIDNKLILSAKTNIIPGVSDDRLNMIYNACDVGINTSMGEGWGLTNFEHAATKRTQIVPRHSACEEIWKDSAIFIETIADFTYDRIDTLARIPDFNSIVASLEAAYEMWSGGTLKEYDEKAYEVVTRPEYNWKNIARTFDEVFTKVLT